MYANFLLIGPIKRIGNFTQTVRMVVFLGAHGEGDYGLTAGGLGAWIPDGDFQVDPAQFVDHLFVHDPRAAG